MCWAQRGRHLGVVSLLQVRIDPKRLKRKEKISKRH